MSAVKSPMALAYYTFSAFVYQDEALSTPFPKSRVSANDEGCFPLIHLDPRTGDANNGAASGRTDPAGNWRSMITKRGSM